jgi:hypothetical protein
MKYLEPGGNNMRILILGASYGSLLSTKLLMAGHDATLVCREQTAELINREGTTVRMTFRGESEPRLFKSADLPGKLDAVVPQDADPGSYDLICFAMQEPQYGASSVKQLMKRIAASARPCLSIMNMPPLAYLRRIDALADADLDQCFTDPSVWQGFEPGLVSLCSPDPQAFRPPEEKPNFLHVGLPTNFKAAEFERLADTQLLNQLESDISNLRVDGKEVPVKLKVHQSLFVPMAKWSMLLTGNYRCVTQQNARAIHDAVHTDLDASRDIYHWVDELARKLGADSSDQVAFEKYANAAKSLLKPSSAARAIDAGATHIERVDALVQLVGMKMGMQLDAIDRIVATVDQKLAQNGQQAA